MESPRPTRLQVRAGESKRIDPADLTRVAYARMVRKGWGERTLSHTLGLGGSWRLPLPNAETPCWGLVADYRAELRALTLGARLAACRSGFDNRAVVATIDEYSTAAVLRYVLDYRSVSLALGIDAGLTVTRQSFESSGPAPTRWATSPLGAVAVAASVPFGSRYFAAIEGLGEVQLMRFQESALVDPELRWTFAPRLLLSLGLQI